MPSKASQLSKSASKESLRVVVDELFDDGSVRLLCSRRLNGQSPNDYSIHTWGIEREMFLSQWQVEAYVGFPTERKLREGDVFFLADGRNFNKSYRNTKRKANTILSREIARRDHLLLPWDASIHLGREEIKAEANRLVVDRLDVSDAEKSRLRDVIDQNKRAKLEKEGL